MTKLYHPLSAIVVLLLASLACNALLRGGNPPPTPTRLPDLIIEITEAPPGEGGNENAPTADPGLAATPEDSGDTDGSGGGNFDTDFPLPDDVSNFTDLGNRAINFQTGMKLDETIAFYKKALADQGLKERPLLTVVSDTTFSMVFDGAANGQSVVVQGVDLGNGATNVNIRYETVP
jgi:hypothetical protein